MTHNLLLTQYDYYCTLFINGQIPWSLFEAIENEYNRKKELFEICLN